MREASVLDSLKVLRGLVVATLVVSVAVLAGSFLLPREVHVERQIVVDRSPHTVFTVLNGFQNFEQWSPWARLDPEMGVTHSGPSHGVGARYAWSSEMAAVGSGQQEITLSEPLERIEIDLEFSGMDAEQIASFQLEPVEQGTRVTWALDVDLGSSLFGRYFGLLLDRMVGADYEKGLADLKAFVESLPDANFSQLEVEVTSVEAQRIAYLSAETSTDSSEIGKAYAEAFANIRSALARDGLKPLGAPLVIGREWDADAGRFSFDAAYPVAATAERNATRTNSPYQLGQTYSGRVLKTEHVGPYAHLSEHFRRLMAYKKAMGFQDNGAPWDVYVSMHEGANGDAPVTETYIPVK